MEIFEILITKKVTVILDNVKKIFIYTFNTFNNDSFYNKILKSLRYRL